MFKIVNNVFILILCTDTELHPMLIEQEKSFIKSGPNVSAEKLTVASEVLEFHNT